MILQLLFLCFFTSHASSNALSKIQPIAVIGTQEENDLELFAKQDETNKGLFEIVDRTQTMHGQHHLKNILKNPLTSIAQLQQRQHIIAMLINNPELIAKIDAQLAIARQHEPAMAHFNQEQDTICKTTLDDFYFTNNHLKKQNENPTLLNVLQGAQIGAMFAPIIEHAMLHWLISDKMREYLHIGCTHIHPPKGHVHSDKCNHGPTDCLASAGISAKLKIAYDIYNIAHWAVHLYGMKSLYDHIQQKLKLSKVLQTKVIEAHKCLDSLKSIYTEINATPQLSQHLLLFFHLETLFKTPSKKIETLQNLLNKNTFATESSLMSNMGNTLAAHKMMRDCTELDNALAALGEIDAYVSIAKLYNEHNNQEHRYSFARYITHGTQPHIHAQEFWNPTIGSQQCSANNIELGINNPNTLIITGPNMAGKSTNLKSVSLIVLLGQTFTIVPAQSAEFTPFAKITTFMRHNDDIQAGTSLFTAELIKANQFIDTLQSIDAGQFSLVMFDELFKSTSFQKGQTTAYNLINYIGNFKNNLCMVSTHYPQLTALEETDNRLFKNYTASVEKNDDGKSMFILKQGSSTSQQSFDVINDQGIAGIWDSAE